MTVFYTKLSLVCGLIYPSRVVRFPMELPIYPIYLLYSTLFKETINHTLAGESRINANMKVYAL